MLKSVKVNYPKRKPRLRLEDLVDVSEPERYSMYQVLLDNLKIANRATFVHRIVYVGSHFFGSYEDATDVFENIITRSNETYCIEKLTGFFLYYPHYFVHVMEGDEDNLNKHLGFLLDKKAKHADRLGVTKLLIHVSHINQRFFENWIHFTGVPPKLLEQLDISGDLLQSGRYIYNCIKKIYSLIGNYADDLTIAAENVVPPKRSCDVGTLSSEESEHASHIFPSFSYASHQSTSLDRSDLSCTKDYKLFLPEYEMLDFILKSQYTMKLEEYYGLYGVVPMRDIYKDRVWPVPHDFIPYDVFEKPYDCITELPKDSWRNKPLVTTPSGTPIDKSRAKFAEDTKDKENLKNEKTKRINIGGTKFPSTLIVTTTMFNFPFSLLVRAPTCFCPLLAKIRLHVDITNASLIDIKDAEMDPGVEWVLGHQGIEGNKTANMLARKGALEILIRYVPACGLSYKQHEDQYSNISNTGWI